MIIKTIPCIALFIISFFLSSFVKTKYDEKKATHIYEVGDSAVFKLKPDVEVIILKEIVLSNERDYYVLYVTSAGLRQTDSVYQYELLPLPLTAEQDD